MTISSLNDCNNIIYIHNEKMLKYIYKHKIWSVVKAFLISKRSVDKYILPRIHVI